MEDPSKFKPKQILSCNSTERRTVLLGQVEEKEGEAILIINPKTPNMEYCNFTKVNKIFQNDIYSRFDVYLEGQYQIQAIFPVNEKHKSKYREKKIISIKQTAEDYNTTKDALLQKELKHIGWVKNIITGVAEAERVLFRSQQFLIVPDFKFSNLKEIQNLYLLVIFVDEGLHSIRDLRGCHINLLKNCEKEVNKILASQFGLDEGTCRMFFHYPPTFYQLHVHVTNLRCQAANALVERAHLLQNVINNLEVDSNYYCKVSLMKTVEKQLSN